MSPPLSKKSRKEQNDCKEDVEEDLVNKSLSDEDDSVNESLSDVENEDDLCSDDAEAEMLQMTFAGKEPHKEDIDGITQLLRSTLNSIRVDSKELAQLIINQKILSTVLIQENEEDDPDESADTDSTHSESYNIIFGVISLLNFNKLISVPCISNIRKHILAKLKQQRDSIPSLVVKKFGEVLGDDVILETKKSMPAVGFLINERFINIPPQASVRMFENLLTDMKKEVHKFDFYLMIINLISPYTENTEHCSKVDDYVKVEETLIDEKAEWSFVYTIDNKLNQDNDEEGPQMVEKRKVILFEASLFPEIVKKMQNTLNIQNE